MLFPKPNNRDNPVSGLVAAPRLAPPRRGKCAETGNGDRGPARVRKSVVASARQRIMHTAVVSAR